MLALASVVAVVLSAEPASGRWTTVGSDDGVYVTRRGRPGSELQEFRATGLIDAPPQKVWSVVSDLGRYAELTPYTEETKVLGREGKVTDFYALMNAPLISRRDCLVRYEDKSEWKEGSGFLSLAWRISPRELPEKPGVVRVKTSEGEWRLEPREGGKRTFATYSIFMDPGGSIPVWMVNKLAGSGMPDLFKTLRKLSAK